MSSDNLLSAQLVFNEENKAHFKLLAVALEKADTLECMIAFAKMSGLKLLLPQLQRALTRGMQARFTLGLSFYQTEPALLQKLFDLGRKLDVSVFVSKKTPTFHPKVYAIRHGSTQTILVGSANLTSGGLLTNFETSVLLREPAGGIMAQVTTYVDKLVKGRHIRPLTQEIIDVYSNEFDINQIHQAYAYKLSKAAMESDDLNVGTLHVRLEMMKADDSPFGFEKMVAERKANQKLGQLIIARMAASKPQSSGPFQVQLDALLKCFHSGGLHRGKRGVVGNYRQFLAALRAAERSTRMSPAAAFEQVREELMPVNGAGVNLLTEVLMTLNSRRFANMNQAAVYGMTLANVTGFPKQPSKLHVDGRTYTRFCKQADKVRRDLGLKDFIELDALFNYAYWLSKKN